MTEKIDAGTLSVLRTAEVEGQQVQLTCGELPRDAYERVDEVLRRLGGKWKGGRTQAHVFEYEPAEALAEVIESGDMPPDNPLAFFATLDEVIDVMITELGDLGFLDFPNVRVLEPSAGTGAIADRVREELPSAQLTCIEVHPLRADILRRKGHDVIEGDFLRHSGEYDVVLMNPPFSVDGRPHAGYEHIRHAFDLLAEGGYLVSVASSGFTVNRDAVSREFGKFVMQYGDWQKLPAGVFAETNVSAVLVSLRKFNLTWQRESYQGYHCWHCWAAAMWADNEPETHRRKGSLFRRLADAPGALDLFGYPVPAWREEIRNYYEFVARVANEKGEGVFLDEEDHTSLVDVFVEQYQEWNR